MAYIEWEESFLTGIPEIDSQHKALVMILNKHYENMQKKDLKHLLLTIERLENYAKVHFEEEEFYFMESSFPEKMSHRMEHQNFIIRVADLKGKILKLKEYDSTADEVFKFLSDWLVKHIKVVDKLYLPYLIQNRHDSKK
ncbi:MAG: bacteriohemerythrin [Candidatus Delongbacteria bacterium]|nr:bacteriohemerythrin [Candidatus Delongbacteria bacterium]MBN2834456.1 bacteriohemerythrin [Candidatus Delongbacteria bacterium]